MRLAFMGSPAFALPALRALNEVHEIVAVYCQPPRPAGRGNALTPSPVHTEALRLGLDVRTPVRLRREIDEQEAFAALGLEACVVAAYGLILPQAMLDAPARGCLNIHASLLPRWRGAGPIQAAVLAGDHESGVTIMQMEAGLDTGPMLLRGSVPIDGTTTAATRHDALAELGGSAGAAGARREAGAAAAAGDRHHVCAQADAGRWPDGLVAECGRARSASARAGAVAGGVYGVARRDAEGAGGAAGAWGGGAGTALDDRLLIACGEGALRLLRVQRPGRGPMDAEAMLRGVKVPAGTLVG